MNPSEAMCPPAYRTGCPPMYWPPQMAPTDVPSTSSGMPMAPSTMPNGMNSNQGMPFPPHPQYFAGNGYPHPYMHPGGVNLNSPHYAMVPNSEHYVPNGNPMTGAPPSMSMPSQMNNDRCVSRGSGGPGALSSPSVSSSVDLSNGMSPYNPNASAMALKNGMNTQMPPHSNPSVPVSNAYNGADACSQQQQMHNDGVQYLFSTEMYSKAQNAVQNGQCKSTQDWHKENVPVGKCNNPGDGTLPNGQMAGYGNMPTNNTMPSGGTTTAARGVKRKASTQMIGQSPGGLTSSPQQARPESVHNLDFQQPMSNKSLVPDSSSADAFRSPSGPVNNTSDGQMSGGNGNDEDNPLKKIERMTESALKEPSGTKVNRTADIAKDKERQAKLDYIAKVQIEINRDNGEDQPQPPMAHHAMAHRMHPHPQMRFLPQGAFPPGMPPNFDPQQMAAMRASGFMPGSGHPHPYAMPMMHPSAQMRPFHPMQMYGPGMGGQPSPTLPGHPNGGPMQPPHGPMPPGAMPMPPQQMMPSRPFPPNYMHQMGHPAMMHPGMRPGFPPHMQMDMANMGGMPPNPEAFQQQMMPWQQGHHQMPQPLANLDSRVPNQKVQYLPNGEILGSVGLSK